MSYKQETEGISFPEHVGNVSGGETLSNCGFCVQACHAVPDHVDYMLAFERCTKANDANYCLVCNDASGICVDHSSGTNPINQDWEPIILSSTPEHWRRPTVTTNRVEPIAPKGWRAGMPADRNKAA
ncbi:hypothetical protein TruAng_004011 [Truncatella angustata]|nr:hypothetical protein TruAng_004011 [Truncatella angustata]